MQNKRAGFTLVELLVAAALFALIMVVAVNLFVLFLKTPLRQIDNHHLYEEVIYVFEQLTYQVHPARIDYDRFGSISNPTTELYLLSAKGNEQYRVYMEEGQIQLEHTVAGITTSTPLTSTPTEDVYIDTLNFMVYPTVDPFDVTTNTNVQPAVMVFISGHSVHDPTITFHVQTLLTLRAYER